MANLRLGRYEVEEYDLPRVCMVCGARATHYKEKRFQWSPPWAYMVLGAIGAMIFMKRMTMSVPLCDKHKWHFWRAGVFALLGLLVLVVWGLGGAILAGQNEDLAPFIFLPFAVALLAWLVTLIVFASQTIRPTEITDKSITLCRVSEKFIRAMDEARRGDRDDEDDEEDRPRRRRRRDEDDRPRTKRRAADEDDGGYYDPDRRGRVRRGRGEGEDDR